MQNALTNRIATSAKGQRTWIDISLQQIHKAGEHIRICQYCCILGNEGCIDDV